MPKVSIAVPVYNGMPNADFFLKRCLDSIQKQTFKDYEVVITQAGKMAENTNAAIKQSKGELVKVLYMDDYLAHENALTEIVKAMEEYPHSQWLISACKHDPGTHTHYPVWSTRLLEGVNTIGSPSVLTMRRENAFLFDEELGWLLDCDLYWRLDQEYGQPIYLDDVNVTIGVGEHQTTHLMPEEEKLKEHMYLKEKYA